VGKKSRVEVAQAAYEETALGVVYGESLGGNKGDLVGMGLVLKKIR
jgi:hypothetical protein